MTSRRMHPTIQTSSGHYVNLKSPEKSYFCVEDIAHALSNLCRFNGHCLKFYSVAQHSVYVSRVVPEEMAMDALFHDAVEAYMGDMTSPLKALLPEYRRMEKLMEAALRKSLKLSPTLHPAIKEADLRMLATEQLTLMPRLTTPWEITKGVRPYTMQIIPSRPGAAFAAFMGRYAEIKEAYSLQQRQGTMQP